MLLQFDPKKGLVVPSVAETRERIAKKLQDVFYTPGEPPLDVEPSTPAGQMVDLIVAEIQSGYSSFAYLIGQLSPLTAEGRFQDAYASLYSIARKIAEPTVVKCELTGLPGTVVPYGAQARNESGVIVINTKAVTLDVMGRGSSFFRTQNYGAITIPSHSVTQIVSTVAGWDTVDNEAAGVLGRLEESRSELEARRLLTVARNSHGAATSVEGTIASLPGVLDCKVLENVTNEAQTQYGLSIGAHSLAICVFGGEDADIARAIFNKKDAGCGTSGATTITYQPESGLLQTYQITRPTPKTFQVQLSFKSSNLSEDLKADITAAVLAEFNGEGVTGNPRIGIAQTVYALRFGSVVQSVLPSATLVGVAIGWKSSSWVPSLNVNVDQEPVMTADDVKFVFGA